MWPTLDYKTNYILVILLDLMNKIEKVLNNKIKLLAQHRKKEEALPLIYLINHNLENQKKETAKDTERKDSR